MSVSNFFTGKKSSLLFIVLFLLILPLSLAAISIPIQFMKRAAESPVLPTPILSPSPAPTVTPILVCDPTCYFSGEQCNDRITPVPGSGYRCQINPACSKDCTPEKISERGNDYWCTAYCKQIIPTATPTPIVSPTVTPSPTGSISPTPILTLTPAPSVSPSTTPPPEVCPLKSQGDANCDNKVDLPDFFIWRSEFLKYSVSIVPPTGGWKSDFNNDSKVDLKDFFVWRKGFLAKWTPSFP